MYHLKHSSRVIHLTYKTTYNHDYSERSLSKTHFAYNIGTSLVVCLSVYVRMIAIKRIFALFVMHLRVSLIKNVNWCLCCRRNAFCLGCVRNNHGCKLFCMSNELPYWSVSGDTPTMILSERNIIIFSHYSSCISLIKNVG